jgi:hypothetical protein
MAELKLGARVRLHADGRVGVLWGVKYVGSPQGKRPLFYVKFSPESDTITFCREEDFVVLPDEDEG